MPANVAESMPGDDVAGPCHDALAEIEAQNKERKGNLQAEAPGDGAPANVAAVRGTQPGSGEHSENSEQSGKASQRMLLRSDQVSVQMVEAFDPMCAKTNGEENHRMQTAAF